MTMTRRRLLDDTFKKSVVGNPAIATDSLARRYPGITMQGWTEQPQYEGNQLFDASKIPSKTQGGATVTNNGDGSFTITGEGQLTTLFIVNTSISGDEARKFLRAGTLRTNMVGKVPEFYVYAQDSDREVLFSTASTGASELTDEILGSINKFYYVFYSVQGDVITPGIVWPMAYQDGDGTYEPYTGGAPSPSPEYPQPITSAGKYNEDTQKWEYGIELAGKNLFDEKSVKEITNFGITVEWLEDEGCFLLNGTCTNTATFALTDINLKGNIGSNYTASVHKITGDVSVPDGGFCVAYFGKNDSPASGGTPKENWLVSSIENEVPATGVSNRKYINTFWFYITKGVSLVNCKLNVMFEQGNTATEYEPYRTPQTVTLTADRPLTKWDGLEKRNGQWGWVYKSAKIESYTDESVPGEYFSTTGQLSTGAQVWYETTTETFAPLTTAEQEAMNNLYTYRPTTVLSNEQDCQMTLTYKTRKGVGGVIS